MPSVGQKCDPYLGPASPDCAATIPAHNLDAIELVALSASQAHPSVATGDQEPRHRQTSKTAASDSATAEPPHTPARSSRKSQAPSSTTPEAHTDANADDDDDDDDAKPKMLNTRSLVPVFVVGMLITGISNSLLNKYQDMQCVANCDSPDPRKRQEFSQPVWQTLQMFLGECLCLLPILLRAIYARVSGNSARDAALKRPLLQAPPDSGIVFDGDASPRDRGVSAISSYQATRGRVHTGATHAPTDPSVPVPPFEIASRAVQPGELDESAFTTANDSSYLDVDTDEIDAVKGETMSGKAVGLFFMPALCDICGTTLMNVGLLFTPVSIYQMTRGALVLWVGVFSVIFLRRHLHLFQWLSLVTVMMGVSVVGLSGTVFKAPEASPSSDGDDEIPETAQALLGVLLILFAQLFTASQFVLEEKIMSRYSVEPLLAVGYEGLFGAATTLVAMPLLHYFVGSTPEGRGGYFDMSAGFYQIISVPAVLRSSIAICFTIAFFNFFGLSVTRNVSATARSTIDTCRTLGIWVVSLTLGWETFKLQSGSLQVLGFVLLVYGTFLFNGIVSPPGFCMPRERGGYSHLAQDENASEFEDEHRRA
ncbi:predicted integral membrane protein [Moesziomyces antarcticus T-34]|uniref:Predicted integral membrane protein n=1 Tax=Pseudozyma antarctica (strain T-34) TaxID=1151754 RepID=M9MF04_PSEA3|nr:predicted integral membrane protein [Moesziomyces antarcticus T-34]